MRPHLYLSDQNGDLVGHTTFQERKIICSPVSGLKIGPDRPSVHTRPTIRTTYLVRFRPDFMVPFRSQIGPVLCEHLDRFVLVPGFGTSYCFRARYCVLIKDLTQT